MCDIIIKRSCEMKLFGRLRLKKTNKWCKKNVSDEVWWLDNLDQIGEHVFSFDKKTKFNLFADYPHKLTPEQKEIFDKENPYWKDFFKDRCKQEQMLKNDSNSIWEKHNKRVDLLSRLETEKLYTSTESESIFSGHYDYNPVIWDVFDEVGVNNPEYKSYDNYLAKKDINKLSSREIVEQFLFWQRGERFCEGTIVGAIDKGDFVNLFKKFIAYNNPRNNEWVD